MKCYNCKKEYKWRAGLIWGFTLSVKEYGTPKPVVIHWCIECFAEFPQVFVQRVVDEIK